ncbi:SMI1/KNR4 family protein [Macrococcus capreoli]
MNYEEMENLIEVRGNNISNSDIEAFEAWIGYKLPNYFKAFTLKYPGAYVEGSFDAEDRPGASINQFLKFEKSEFDSIYIDSLYEFTDFGPYVLFACDAGGNYLAFDYSNDKLNHSIVFIEHEELGIIEFPDGKSENDFTEEELDKMMSSEKLEDYPWAIHYVSEDFNKFIDIVDFNEIIYDYSPPEYITTREDINFLEKYMNIKLPNSYKNFVLELGGIYLHNKNIFVKDDNKIQKIYGLNIKEQVDVINLIEVKGGKEKFKNLIPIIAIEPEDQPFHISTIAIQYLELENRYRLVHIPFDIYHYSETIDRKKLEVISEDLDDYLYLLTKELKLK